jgi:hypothetical protein
VASHASTPAAPKDDRQDLRVEITDDLPQYAESASPG